MDNDWPSQRIAVHPNLTQFHAQAILCTLGVRSADQWETFLACFFTLSKTFWKNYFVQNRWFQNFKVFLIFELLLGSLTALLLKKVRLMFCTLFFVLLRIDSHTYSVTLQSQHLPHNPASISWHTHGAIYWSFRNFLKRQYILRHACSLTALSVKWASYYIL
jgi:hypothetical protein